MKSIKTFKELMAKILREIKGSQFPKLDVTTEYQMIFNDPKTYNSAAESEIKWQLFICTVDGSFEKVSFSGQKIGKKSSYRFLKNLLHKNLLLRAYYKSEIAELRITPQMHVEKKIIGAIFTGGQLDFNKNLSATGGSFSLKIYTLNLKGKNLNFKITEQSKSKDALVLVGRSTNLVTQNELFTTPKLILSESELNKINKSYETLKNQNFTLKIWERGNEQNFFEKEINFKNIFPTKTFITSPSIIIKDFETPEEKITADCGAKHRNSFFCTRYGKAPATQYGPLHTGVIPLKNFAQWTQLINTKKLSRTEFEIICGMSVNEGNMDAVQSYDSEIATLGAMQKTINLAGFGELPLQLSEFQTEYPKDFKVLLEDCGWSIRKENGAARIYYKGITGTNLKNIIRVNCSSENYGKKVISTPLESFVALAKNENFQLKQIEDFISRLRSCLQQNIVQKYHRNEAGLRIADSIYSIKIGEVFLSKLGRATILDQSVNRPSLVKFNVGEALNRFFTKNPGVSKNLKTWGSKHAIYEKELLNDYGNNREGTDMKARFLKLKANALLQN